MTDGAHEERLPGRGEKDVAAAEIEAEVAGGGGVGNDLERVGARHAVIANGGGAEEFVACDVHDDDLVVGDEAEAVGSGREGLVSDLQMDFVEEVALVGLLDGGGVTGVVDERHEDEIAAGEADAGGVAALDGSALSFVEDGGGKNCGGLGTIEGADLGI